MKKIENIVDNCIDCRFAQAVYSSDAGRSTARLCTHVNPPRFAGFDGDGAIIFVPDWCPLGMNKEVEQSEAQLAAAAATPSTIILPGLPHLEWMTENLSGFGGTEVDGRTYYTYDEAVAAVEQLGDGWRLSTTEEWEILDRLGSVWQDGPHGLPGRLFGGGLFLEAAGWSHRGSGNINECRRKRQLLVIARCKATSTKATCSSTQAACTRCPARVAPTGSPCAASGM